MFRPKLFNYFDLMNPSLFGKPSIPEESVRHHDTCPACGRTLVNLYKRGDRWLCKKCWDREPAYIPEIEQSSTQIETDIPATIDKELKFIKTWEELKECTSETHILEIGDGYGWILPKDSTKSSHYLSTHTFYGSSHKHSTELLQSCGFYVELANWDDLGW